MKKDLYYRYSASLTILWLTAAFLFFTIAGCKKDKSDGQSPVITIHLPVGGNSFNYNDDIPISATVTDETSLEFIRVQIVNEQNQTFLSQTEYTNSGTQKEIAISFAHDDLYLTSGIYYIKITARDKDNESIAFREIQLIEVPLQLKRVYLIRGNNFNTQVDTLTNDGTAAFINLPFGYQNGAINSRNNLLLANNDDRLHILNAQTLEQQTSYHYNTSTTLNSTYDSYTQSVFTGTIDGYIFETDRNGINSTYAYLPQQKILNLLVTENYIFADVQNMSQTMRSIFVYKKNTRTIIQSAQIYFDLKELIYLGNEDKILAVGNESGEGVLKYYNRTTNFFNEIFTFYNHSVIHDAWPTASNQFIISQGDGLISYAYNLDMLSVGLSLQPTQLVYEKITGLNFAINENGVYVLNTNATSQLNFYPSVNCKDVLLLYNK